MSRGGLGLLLRTAVLLQTTLAIRPLGERHLQLIGAIYAGSEQTGIAARKNRRDVHIMRASGAAMTNYPK